MVQDLARPAACFFGERSTWTIYCICGASHTGLAKRKTSMPVKYVTPLAVTGYKTVQAHPAWDLPGRQSYLII